MPTRTLSTAVFRSSASTRRRSRLLVLVGDPHPLTVDPAPDDRAPDGLPAWVHGCGWDLWPHPESGPVAATGVARLNVRVLLLRPDGTAPRPGSPGRRPRVVAAVRGLPDDGPVVTDAATCAARAGAALILVHGVPRSFAGRSVGLDGAVAHGSSLLDAAAQQAVTHEPGLPVDRTLLRVRPHELVGEALDADLLVVGGGRRERPGAGLVAHSALHHAPCPVLVVPRVPRSAADLPEQFAQARPDRAPASRPR